jgi:signal transduction histidine kinase
MQAERGPLGLGHSLRRNELSVGQKLSRGSTAVAGASTLLNSTGSAHAWALEQALRDQTEALARERRRCEALEHTCARLTAAQNNRDGAEQAERLQTSALGMACLAQGVAHEINNPLAGLTILFEMLADNPDLPPQTAHYLGAIQEGFGRIERTVKSLLDLSQPQPAQRDAVPLAGLFAEAERQVAAKACRKDVIVHWHATHCVALGNAAQLTVALGHLVDNAVDAAPVATEVTVRCEPRGAQVCILVSDAGCGIPIEYRGRICDPFFTTKRQGEGSGMGLSVAQQIIAGHSGELNFVDRVCGASHPSLPKSCGTEVQVLLPMQAQQA